MIICVIHINTPSPSVEFPTEICSSQGSVAEGSLTCLLTLEGPFPRSILVPYIASPRLGDLSRVADKALEDMKSGNHSMAMESRINNDSRVFWWGKIWKTQSFMMFV